MGSQRGKGEGTYLRRGEKWQFVLRVDGRRLTALAPTKAEARHRVMQRLATAGQKSRSSSTFATDFAETLPELRAELAPTNAAQYAATLAKVRGTPLGETSTDRVTGDLVQSWVDALDGSPVTVRNHGSRVRAVLRRLGRVVRVTLPKPERKAKRTVWGSETDEFRDFARSQPENRRLALLLLIETGLSRSEACGLRHDDRDEDGVFLRLAVTETDEAVVVREKFKRDHRADWVPLTPELLDLIGPPRTGYVLTGTDTPMRPRTLTQLVRRALKGSRWDGHTPQALRRAHGQAVWESTGDILLTAVKMRHSVAMSEKEYLQADRETRRRAMRSAFGDPDDRPTNRPKNGSDG